MEKTLVKIVDCGDSAVSVRFPQEISPEVHAMVLSAVEMIAAAEIPGVLYPVPAYTSVMVPFDPTVTCGETVKDALSGLLSKGPVALSSEDLARVVEIPVCYGGEWGPDLGTVAEHTGLSRDEVIALHTGTDYPVYMIGFTAGFPYLGGMDQRLATPRLSVPREHIEAGSVGIAGNQTGIYSVASPGGWQIIGRTPLKLFDPEREEPFLVSAGDRIRFVSISEEEFERIAGEGSAEAAAKAVSETTAEAPAETGASCGTSKAEVTVTNPGLFTTVQDEGRTGYYASGISHCGAMDRAALELGNALLGNDPGAAGLEATLMTPGLRFEGAAEFCLTGGYCEARFSGSSEIIPMNEPVKAPAGAELLPSPVKLGCRTYITFAGGIDTPPILGSRSSDGRASVGGPDGGRKLVQGDALPLGHGRRESGAQASSHPGGIAPSGSAPMPRNTAQLGARTKVLFVTKGPQFSDLSEAGVRTFLSGEYTVSSSSDRMGTRFDGPVLEFAEGSDGNIITDGILPGAIQVVPSGHPILMNADAQVSGGYSKPFWLASVSRSASAQLKPGDRVRFVLISTGESLRRLRS